MSNGNGVRQDQSEEKEDHNPYQMVEDFLRGLTGLDYSDVVMAMLAGAARVSILENDSLELFKAQAVVAYERMDKMINPPVLAERMHALISEAEEDDGRD